MLPVGQETTCVTGFPPYTVAIPVFSEKGVIVVGGRLRAPSDYIFRVKTFAIGGRQTIAKGAFAFGAQGGGHAPVPPAYAPGSGPV